MPIGVTRSAAAILRRRGPRLTGKIKNVYAKAELGRRAISQAISAFGPRTLVRGRASTFYHGATPYEAAVHPSRAPGLKGLSGRAQASRTTSAG
jgi:hypothetical protein